MPVFHCPLCPLIFEYRTEVEYHLRNEHRSRADEEAELAAESAAAITDLDWPTLRTLQSVRTGIAVTVVMATIPGPTMTGLDVARLRRLANMARRRLSAEPGAVGPNLEQRLARAVAVAEGSRTEEGLVLLVDAHHLAIFRLPFEPKDRVVVDPSFATRELEAALHCFPAYRVLVLGRTPRLFEGRGSHLRVIDDHPAEAPAAPAVHDRDGRRSFRSERWSLRRSRRHAGVLLADDLLAERAKAAGDMPLIVAGDSRWRAEFRDRSRHGASIIGEIPGIRNRDGAEGLANLSQPHLTRRLQDDQAVAVADLERADACGDLAWGVGAAWAAVYDGTADLLWVEQGYSRAGRPTENGATVELVDNAEQPGVHDDVIDDLIQAAAARHVRIHLLTDGTLDRPEPIAARLRGIARVEQAPLAAAQAG